jgi:hypothetical protein
MKIGETPHFNQFYRDNISKLIRPIYRDRTADFIAILTIWVTKQ